MTEQPQRADGSSNISPGIFYKILKLFTVIHPGEAVTAALLALNVYLLFLAYYVIKPIREALILTEQGPVFKSALSAASAVLLIFVVKGFSRLADRFPRHKLITWVTLFFIFNLVIFYLLSLAKLDLGIFYFIWMGIFNVMVVAQFWAFANDIYTKEAGERLFPMIAFGAVFGGFSGSVVTEWLVQPLGLYQMMLVAGGILGICIILTWVIHVREVRIKTEDESTGNTGEAEKNIEKPLGKGGGFRLVFKKRYLLYIALFVLLLNFINTNGEFILGDYVTNTAHNAVANGTTDGMSMEEYIGKFYAGFGKYLNLLAMFIQLFAVSRLFRWIGVRGALFVLPLIAMGGYFMITMGASLMLLKWVKIAENGTDYSLMNTARNALFLITSREEKYKAKAAIDTFFHRGGDMFSALLVLIGTYFAFTTENFAVFNVVLVFVWIVIGIKIAREHKKLTTQK